VGQFASKLKLNQYVEQYAMCYYVLVYQHGYGSFLSYFLTKINDIHSFKLMEYIDTIQIRIR